MITPRFTGLIPAVPTPFNTDGSLMLDAVGPVVDHLQRSRVSALFVCGTTGEGSSLTTAERITVASTYAAAAKGRLPIIVHVGHNSLRDAQALAEHAREIGAVAIAMAPPAFLKPASASLIVDCCAEVAAAAPNLPLYYYHIPSLSGVALPVIDILRAAADRLPSLVGFKYTFENLMDYQQCIEFADGRYDGLFGRDEMLLAALATGANGAVGSTYNFAAPIFHHIIDAFRTGDFVAAKEWQSRAVAMIQVLACYRGLPGLKGFMKLIGCDTGSCRLPLQTMTGAELLEMEGILKTMGFFGWIE